MTLRHWTCQLVAALAAIGCADDTQGFSKSMDRNSFSKALDPGPGLDRFLAVVGGDYKSTTLSLLDLASLPANDLSGTPTRWSAMLHSGSKLGSTALALSGDVVLGQLPGLPRQVLLVDRATAVLTQVFAESGEVVRQVSVASGFYANPQDALAVAPQRWLIPRMGRNPNPTPPTTDFDDGDDVVAVDPTTGILLQSITLAGFSTLPGGVAAPQRLGLFGGQVWLPLGSFAPDFKAQGPARLLAVSPNDLKVVAQVELPTLKNCVAAQPLPHGKLLVNCQGSYAAPAQQIAESALVVVDPATGLATLQVPARAEDGPFGRDAAAFDERWAAAVTLGDFGAQRPDRLWLVDLKTGARAMIAQASEPFGFSGLWADAARRTLWLGDPKQASDLQRFGVSAAGQVTLGMRVSSNPGGLGALELRGL